MIAAYGAFEFDDNSVTPIFSGAGKVYSSRNQAYIQRRRIVLEGEIIPNPDLLTRFDELPDAIAFAKNAVNNAFALDGGDFFFFTNDGGVAYSLVNAGSIGGVRVKEGPTFLSQDGMAHWATGLPFSIALEADYPLLTDGLLEYRETITRVGNGGQRVATIEVDSGPPVKQIVSTNTPITVLQTGEAVGMFSQPAFNLPIYSDPTLLENPEEATGAEAPHLNGGTYMGYVSRWNYRFTLSTNIALPLPLKR